MRSLLLCGLAFLPQADANERTASATLKTFATAQADFRANDRDGNLIADYWSADVSGLYRIDTGITLKLIERGAATADAKPCVPMDKEGKAHGLKIAGLDKAVPRSGYWFAAVEKYEDEKGAPVKYDLGNGRNLARFAFCAWPAEHGITGRHTFIISEQYVVWKMNTGGKPVDLFPADPARSGWTKQD